MYDLVYTRMNGNDTETIQYIQAHLVLILIFNLGSRGISKLAVWLSTFPR